MLKKMGFILFLFLATYTNAAENRNGFWFGTISKNPITDSFSFHIEVQLRYNTTNGETGQILYRPGILHQLNQEHQLAYLYGYIQSSALKEHRWTLQHAWKFGSIGNYDLSHRARYEARFIEDVSEDAGRLRYLLRLDQKNFSNFGFILWNEYFLNTNKTSWNGNSSNDRNRFFIGLKKFFHGENRLELGYLNQYIPRSSRDISEHLIVLYLMF